MLKEMSANGAGVSIAGLYLSSAAHADDIRSLSQTRSATESQAATLVNFTTNNDLKINARQRLLLSQRPTRPQTSHFQLQATK